MFWGWVGVAIVAAVVASGGGHTGYAVAVGEALRRRGAGLVFVVEPGDRWSLERIWAVFGEGAPVVFLPRLRGPGEGLLRAAAGRLGRVSAGVLRLSRVLRRLGVDVVVCTGSNHSLLAALAARLAGVPVVCLEAADRVATRSRTPALLHDVLGVPVALHWPVQRRLYPRRGVVVGPVYPRPPREASDGPPGGVEPGYVLVLTGSVGNPRLVRLLVRTGLERVVLQTGRLTPPGLVSRLRPGWRVFRFTGRLWEWVRWASVVVSHQGLGVVEAALGYGKPVVVAYNPDLYMTSGWEDSVLLARLLNGVALHLGRASPRDLEEAVLEARGRRPPRLPWGAEALADLVLRAARGKGGRG